MSQIKDLRPPKMTKVEKIHKLSGGAPISGLPEIGTSSTQVGYSRLAVRRLEVHHLSLVVALAMSGAAISCSVPVRPLLFRQVFRACALFADSCIPRPPS